MAPCASRPRNKCRVVSERLESSPALAVAALVECAWEAPSAEQRHFVPARQRKLPLPGGEGPYEGCQVTCRSFSFHAIAYVARSAAKRSGVARDSGETTLLAARLVSSLALSQFILKASFSWRAEGPLGQSCSNHRVTQGRLPFECCPGWPRHQLLSEQSSRSPQMFFATGSRRSRAPHLGNDGMAAPPSHEQPDTLQPRLFSQH